MDIWEKEFYACDCGTELILLSLDKEIGLVYFNIFENGHFKDNTLGFGRRIRWCWDLLRTGKPWKDEICLDYKTARELADTLLKIAKEEPAININDFAKSICKLEKGKVEVNIAQMKDVLNKINKKLKGEFYKLIRAKK